MLLTLSIIGNLLPLMIRIRMAYTVNNIDLNLLNVFLKIFESGSLSKAAHSLNVSQPGVSLALKRLRDHFDDPLFVRTSKGMEPTVFAQALFLPLKKSVESIQEVLSLRLDFEANTSDRLFKLSMSDFGQLIFLPRLLEKMSEVAPAIRVEVNPITPDVESQLSQGDIDLVLGFTHAVKGHFHQQLLLESGFTGLVSKNHPDIDGEITKQQYQDMRHVTIKNQTSGFYIVKKYIEDIGIRRYVTANLSNYTSVSSVLSATNCFMTTPVLVADTLMKQGNLKKVRLPFELPSIKFMQHWHARQDQDPGSRWLRSLISSLQTG